MAKKKVKDKRYEKAVNILYDETATEIILDSYEASDFIEFIVEMGGDVGKYRVFNDGTVYEK